MLFSFFSFVNENSDKCHICMGILNGLDSILGLFCIILPFMPMFLRLRLVSACFGF